MESGKPNKVVNDELLHIGGAVWRMVKKSTIEHDFETMRTARAIGADEAGMLPGESAADYASRLLYLVIDSGKVFELLGCLLLPEHVPDEKWTREEAVRTADFLRVLVDPQDKAQIQDIVLDLLIGFFSEGLRLCGVSSTVLMAQTQPGADEHASASPGSAATI